MKNFWIHLILIACVFSFISMPENSDAAQALPGNSMSRPGMTGMPKQAQEMFVAQVKVTNPQANAQWRAGTPQSIQWEYQGTPPGLAKILLTKNAAIVHTIDAGHAWGQSGKGWIIPYNMPGSIPEGDGYRIKIVSTTDEKYFGTSGLFRIMPYTNLTVTNPANSLPLQNWKIGSTHNLNWKYTNNCGSHVKIRIMGGVNHNWATYPIVNSWSMGTNGTGSMPWTIPSALPGTSVSWIPGNHYVIHVEGIENPLCWNSTAEFTVSP